MATISITGQLTDRAKEYAQQGLQNVWSLVTSCFRSVMGNKALAAQTNKDARRTFDITKMGIDSDSDHDYVDDAINPIPISENVEPPQREHTAAFDDASDVMINRSAEELDRESSSDTLEDLARDVPSTISPQTFSDDQFTAQADATRDDFTNTRNSSLTQECITRFQENDRKFPKLTSQRNIEKTTTSNALSDLKKASHNEQILLGDLRYPARHYLGQESSSYQPKSRSRTKEPVQEKPRWNFSTKK